MRKNLSAKPGAERAPFRPDIILHFRPSAPGRLLDFLFEVMLDRKRTTVKDYLKHRQVMVNGAVTTQFDQAVNPGDNVAVNTSREFQTLRNPRLSIVYEDDDIIVVNKGYGLLSVGTDKIKTGTAYSILRDYLKRVDPRNKVFIVHRLDQHTSGLMMFAKNVKAKEAMQHNWNNMVLERRYVCVVEGKLDPPEGEIRSYLAENSQHEVYSTEDPNAGQLAVTRYRTLRSANGYSLVEVQLETGRKNQIRVHMKDLGHPIAGDRKYGAKTSPIHRLALHAMTLRFAHPANRADMNFSTPIPAPFAKMVK
ncbi:MAG: RluA family pseudouridine synthase [Muribaculaceae bacterium]|nr:RluA family pseudouridine synthase [Muribaculaceae bacterium]